MSGLTVPYSSSVFSNLSVGHEDPRGEPIFILIHPGGDDLTVATLDYILEIADDVFSEDTTWGDRFSTLYIKHSGKETFQAVGPAFLVDGDQVFVTFHDGTTGKKYRYLLRSR